MEKKILAILEFYLDKEKAKELLKLIMQVVDEKKKLDTKAIESHKMLAYIIRELPNVSKLKLPTPEQCDELIRTFTSELVLEQLEAMENYKLLTKKYQSTYLTLKNWCNTKQQSGWTKKETSTEKTTGRRILVGNPPQST